MNKVFASVMSTALSTALLLTACGGGGAAPSSDGSGTAAQGGGSAPAAEQTNDPVTLRIAWWGGQARHDYTLKVIEKYMENNPHVKIESEYASFDDYWKKLAPQAAANGLPDIIQMDLSYLSQYGGRGQLEDLQPYMDNGTINVTDIAESTLSGGKLNGQTVAISLGSNALQSTVDMKMLEESGAAVSEDWTLEDLDDIGAALAANGKLIASELRHDVYFPFYLRQQGLKMYAEDGTSLGYPDDQPFIDYYTMYKRWYDAGYLLSLDKNAQKKGIPEDDEVVMGNAFSSNGWSNQYIMLAKTAQRPLDVLPPPGWNQNKALFLKPSMFFSIAKSSGQKEEAAKFIDFWLNDIEANQIIKGERGVPVSAKVKEALMPDLSPEEQKIFEYVTWAEQNSGDMDPPNPIGAVEVDKLLKDTAEQILYNQISVEEGAAKFREEANAILAKNK